MSILSSFTKNSRLQAAIKTVTQARKSEGGKADQLFIKAYSEFADVISGDLVLAQSLYNWGFALLQQAKTKEGAAAIKLYEEAIAKFSFCATVDPNFLGAAIDGGVAYMELARLKAVNMDDVLYGQAKVHFERAEKIHKGTAIYNLACIYALMGNDEACLSALNDAVKHGCLPNQQEVLNDPDLEKVVNKAWFLEFIEANKPVPPKVKIKAVVEFEVETTNATETSDVQEVAHAEVAQSDADEVVEEPTPSEAVVIRSEHYS